MKPLFFLAASALALGTAACTPPHPAARAALDCPSKSGPLRLTGVSPDGKACTYANDEGDEVSLRLIPVSGGARTTLKGLEDELNSQYVVPPPAARPEAAGKTPAKADATPPAVTGDAAELAARQAEDDAAGWEGGDRHVRHRGDTTRIDLPGIHIRADDGKGAADVQVGMIQLHANEDGEMVRVGRYVRLRGDMLSPERRGFRASYRISNGHLKDGYEAIGYEAGGPKNGPLAVAVIKSKLGEHHGVFKAVTRLVRRNGGV